MVFLLIGPSAEFMFKIQKIKGQVYRAAFILVSVILKSQKAHNGGHYHG